MLPLCADQGIAVMPCSLLARGTSDARLERNQFTSGADEFGKKLYLLEFPDFRSPRLVDQVSAIASARGVPRAQIALAWLLSRRV